MTGRDLFKWARTKRALVIVIAVSATVVVPLEGATSAAPLPTSSAVRDWNAHALNALANAVDATVPGAAQAPPVSALHMAMVQGAVYDAVNSIDGGHEPYLDGLPPADPEASLDAAVATAAHHVLVGIAPVPALPQAIRDRLDALYAESLNAIPAGPVKDLGIAAGASAAAAMLADRTDDGRYAQDIFFTEGLEPGEWRPTLPNFATDPFAWIALVDPFVLDQPSQFQTQGPRPLASGAYAKEYDEVKDLGAVNSVRSTEQEALARFYTVSPVELFNRTFRGISASQGLTMVEEARLFGMLNLATADTAINCWSDKENFGFWRPITAIREGDDDGNRFTVGDPNWTPLVPTPAYPDHTSGYNCVTGAMMYTGKAFFGTNDMSFDVVRPNVPNVGTVTRTYAQFTAVVDDTIDARVYQGLHFRSADEQGARIGRDVARWLSTHFLRPLR